MCRGDSRTRKLLGKVEVGSAAVDFQRNEESPETSPLSTRREKKWTNHTGSLCATCLPRSGKAPSAKLPCRCHLSQADERDMNGP